jgi:DNA-binding NtrC family response regulator
MEPTLASRSRVEVRGGTLSLANGRGGQPIHIGAEPRMVGRNPGCDLVLADKKVSAAHLELSATASGVRVRDLGSKNGTFLGEHRIVEAYLAEESTLRCGDTLLHFSPAEPEQVPISKMGGFGPLVGSSASMRALFEKLRVVAPSNLAVLILGETGAGKELVAQAIHQASDRSKKPFVVVDCGAIPASLAESALFGHERGAFTGAVSKRISPFVEAQGGTIFLDELGELPLEVQPKLLRVLAEQRIKSVGSNVYAEIDVRVVSATRRDILKEVNLGTFRSDLYFRVAQVRAELPPLRERADDVPALVERIMHDLGVGNGYRRITAESLDRAQRYDWPGNVRELRNVVALAMAYDKGGAIDLAAHITSIQVGAPSNPSAHEPRTFEHARRDLERAYFTALHNDCAGNVSEMARRADVDRKTVRECLRRHGIGGKTKGRAT